MRDDRDVLMKLADLHIQATEERSHYYTGSVIQEAMEEIQLLREELADVKFGEAE